MVVLALITYFLDLPCLKCIFNRKLTKNKSSHLSHADERTCCLQLHAHYCLCASLPGPRLSPSLPFDRADSCQGKNSGSYLKRCAMDMNRCVLALTASPGPPPLPQASVRPNYQMLRLSMWHFLSDNASFPLLVDIYFISATKTHKRRTHFSLVPSWTQVYICL